MKLEFIQAGRIVNAHGVRGDLKLLPQDVDTSILLSCSTLYINGKAYKPTSLREHKGCILIKLPEINDMDSALDMKGSLVTLRRQDLKLPEGFAFDEELLGLRAIDAASGEEKGTVQEVLTYPAHKIYAVRGGGDEYLVPAVPAFIQHIDLEAGTISIHVWEGLGTNEN